MGSFCKANKKAKAWSKKASNSPVDDSPETVDVHVLQELLEVLDSGRGLDLQSLHSGDV